MQKRDFNEGWIVRCLTRDEGEKAITLPHDAMISEPRRMESEGEDNIGWFIGGDYEYTKVFSYEEEWKDKILVLEFEGVYHNAEVFINGEKICERPYGYTNFFVDIDPHLKEGENTLKVIAHNADQPNSRWYSGTGIYRPVWLYTADKETHIPINGVRVRTINAKKGEISIKAATSKKGEVLFEILDGEKIILAKKAISNGKYAKARMSISGAKLWSPETPNLYRVRVSFGDDSATETFGIRELKWSAAEGMTINGKRVILRGACVHHDNGILGACTYAEAEERRVRLLQEAGYNAIRSAHNPCSKYLLDACDKLGMLVMDEYVDCWYIHKTKYDYALYMKDWWKQDLLEMVRKDYNHPSVIMYSTGNEVAETSEPKGIHWQQCMTDFLHRIDATRPVSCGINIFFNFLYSAGFGVYSDNKAEELSKAASDANKEKKKAPVGSEFYNMMAVKLGDRFMKFGATLYPCDVKTRDAYSAMDIAGYNYGIWRYEKDMKKYPRRVILGSETFCKDAWLFWKIAKNNPQIIGDFVWSGIDYIGETGIGAPEYSRYDMSDKKYTCISGGSGRIDITGRLKPEAYYTRICFELDDAPFIAVKPPYEEKKPPITGWNFSRAIDSWSFDGCEGMETEVEVYSAGAEVELLVNGESIGRKKIGKTRRVFFKAPYRRGRIDAISYDRFGKKTGFHTLLSAESDTRLAVEPEKKTTGDALYFVRLRYTDADGITKVCEQHNITIEVEGGVLIGVGNACPYYEGNYTDSTTPTYYGEALAVIKANSDAKGIKLMAGDGEGNEGSAEIAVEETDNENQTGI